MSSCRRQDNEFGHSTCCCNRDYWFKTGHCHHDEDDEDDPRLRHHHRFPRVVFGTAVIPQTSIPFRLVLTDPDDLFTGAAGLTTAGFTSPSVLQAISTSAQTVAAGGAVPFGTNLMVPGSGFFAGF